MNLKQRMRLIVFVLTSGVSIVLAPQAQSGVYDDMLRAASLGNVTMVRNLLGRGMDVNTADPEGNTLLILAARDNQVKLVEMLLQMGASPLKKNRHGDSALSIASLNGHKDTVQSLLAANIKIDSEAGWNALHYATYGGHDNIVQLLLDQAAPEVNAYAPNGQTAAMLAAAGGRAAILRQLKARGADLTLTDAEGRNVLDIAQGREHRELVQYLQTIGITPAGNGAAVVVPVSASP